MTFRISPEEALSRGWIDKEELPKQKSRPAAQRASKREAEGEEQALLIEWFRETYPDIGDLLIHIPNGGSRKNAFEGWRLKRQGVRAGVSDLFLPVARGGFHGLWIEFKATPPLDAAVSQSQRDWIEAMLEQGYHAEVSLGIEAAKEAIERYLAA